MTTTPVWLNYLAAFGAIATPVLVAVLGGIGWKIRSKIEHQLNLEQKLREDRIEIYNEILEPFMVMLMSEEAWRSDPKNKTRDKAALGVRQALSLDYRKTAFRLALLGSDGVVRSYNDLMQSFFAAGNNTANEATEQTVREMLSRIGALLLEIRRSMGNAETDLDRWAMLEWFVQDARKYRSEA